LDAEKTIGRMATRSLEIEQHPAALARMHVRAMACRFGGAKVFFWTPGMGDS
jgi:hypothetical protein